VRREFTDITIRLVRIPHMLYLQYNYIVHISTADQVGKPEGYKRRLKTDTIGIHTIKYLILGVLTVSTAPSPNYPASPSDPAPPRTVSNGPNSPKTNSNPRTTKQMNRNSNERDLIDSFDTAPQTNYSLVYLVPQTLKAGDAG